MAAKLSIILLGPKFSNLGAGSISAPAVMKEYARASPATASTKAPRGSSGAILFRNKHDSRGRRNDVSDTPSEAVGDRRSPKV